MLRGLATSLVFVMTVFAHGAAAYDPATEPCGEALLGAVGKHFGLAHFEYATNGAGPAPGAADGQLAAGVCRKAPFDSEKTIGAFAYDAGVEMEKRMLVVLFDDHTNRVVASYRKMGSEHRYG